MLKYPSDPFHKIPTYQEQLELAAKEYSSLNLPEIPEFYSNREIFITGGTGFLGKALIEKILRSCPKVKKLFLLLRPNKGKTIHERLRVLLDNPLFDALRQIQPNFEQKIIPIDGDVSRIMLGLSQESIEQMKDVSMIFHSAATVKFDDPLKYAIMINTRGTREVMEFALGLKNLKILCHISTTYSNVYESLIKEELYPAIADWRKTIEICEKFTDDELNVFETHYMNFMPNTYVFSKNLAEHVANDYSNRLPIVLLRPSIVLGSIKEPIPGNYNDRLF
jgi:alcohol-forming fatty acyl-CoA reductase